MENEFKKYTLCKDLTKVVEGITVYRIMYNDQTFGGWLESYDNLSQEGKCRVLDEAVVIKKAKVSDDAVVGDMAKIYGYSNIYGNANVGGKTLVFGNAKIFGEAEIIGNCVVHGNAKIYDKAIMMANALVYGNAKVHGECVMKGDSKVFGHAEIFGDVTLNGGITISGDAIVKENKDCLLFRCFWGSGETVTWTRSNGRWNMDWYFNGNDEDFVEHCGMFDEHDMVYAQSLVDYVASLKKQSLV